MPTKIIKNSYNSGEWSEGATGRTDVAKYYNAASKMINATVLPHGGFVKRSGTEFIAQAPNKANLFPFEFSVDDSLILEFSNLLIRFYKDGDRVLETATNITGATQADPVVITDTGHTYLNGEVLRIDSVGGMTELNGRDFLVSNKGVNTYELTDLNGVDIDGTGFTAYTSGGTAQRAYQIVSPYTSEEAFEIHTTQSADVMYIAHEDHHPQKLSRLGDTNWTIEDVPFVGGPFLEDNDIAVGNDVTMTYASTSTHTRSGTDYYFPVGDTGTLTASSATFLGTSADVGTLWLIKHTRDDNSDSKTGTGNWTKSANATTSLEISVEGDFNLDATGFATNMTVKIERKEGNGEWQDYRTFTAAVAFSATEEFSDVLYRVVVTGAQASTQVSFTAREQTNFGIVEVTSANSTTVANVVVIDKVGGEANSGTSTSATKMWAEGAWGIFRGYPRTVEFFEDRLWWASSTNNPDTLWGSKTRFYEDHTTSGIGEATDAIVAPFNDNEVSQIQWMQARQVMAVGAANKEYRFGNPDPDKAVSPEPAQAKSTPQTSYGSNEIQPSILNNAIFYFQRQGRKLRSMTFDAISENFQSENATRLNDSILESSPVKMAVQRVPDSIIWIVRSDGVLLSFTYEPDEEIAGWARHITQNDTGIETPVGFFESIAVIHGSVEDELWVSIRRVIDGNTVRYIEKFGTRFFDQVDEALMLDSAVVVESAFVSQNITLASDTVRCGSGLCNSSLCGGIPA
jgi:hypothetical protein